MSQNLSVRLYADMVFNYSRGIMRGIADYAKIHGGWDFDFNSRIEPGFTSNFARDAVSGVIIQIRQAEQATALLQSGVPTVNVSNLVSPTPPLPSVFPDDVATGRMAGSYFLERGFQNFAFCGSTITQYSRDREQGFTAAIAPCPCAILTQPEGEAGEQECARLLTTLPRPLAIFCCNDTYAREIVREIIKLGFHVPDEVAVLGVDNDEINCELSGVQLSSIRLNTEKIGYEAAALLARLIAQQPAPALPILVPPAEVITRRSTDVLALADSEVATAVRFIRDRGGREINVEDLLRQTVLSRRSLEMRFRKALGRSPYQEIRRVQIERAKLMLSRTDRPLWEIADACGFKETRQLSTAFHDRIGLTPRQYRHRTRGDADAPDVHAGPAPTSKSSSVSSS